MILMKALAAYDDPRVDQVFFKVALQTRDAETRETVTAHLQDKPAAIWLERVRADAEQSAAPSDPEAGTAAGSADRQPPDPALQYGDRDPAPGTKLPGD
jgi:hypothetical protein